MGLAPPSITYYTKWVGGSNRARLSFKQDRADYDQMGKGDLPLDCV